MQQRDLPELPFEVIAIDFTGPLILRGEKVWVLTMIDLLTRWSEAWIVKDNTAETVMHILEQEVFPRYSIPKVILSDNGKELKKKLLNDLLKRMGINRRFSAPYHPQANAVI